MADSTAKPKVRRPRLNSDFPLYVHKGTGYWAKTIRGKRIYFEKLANDPNGQKSLAKWLEQRDDLLAGRSPRRTDAPRLKDLCNSWLTHKKNLLQSGELTKRSFDEYYATCEFVLETIDGERDAGSMQSVDFADLRKKLAKRYNPVSLSKRMGQIKSVFLHAYKCRLIDRPADFGPSFEKPSAKKLRQVRLAKGAQDFTRDELHRMLEVAKPVVRAMILLGVQGGLGNSDVADLPLKAVDLEGGWLDYPRAKTAIARKIPLWPETIEAIKLVISQRPATESPYLFISARGNDYTDKHRTGYRVTGDFRQVTKAIGIQDGRGFYGLRRTFQTQAEESADLVAVQSIMGHTPSERDMSARYRQRISEQRLRAVVEVVRSWLAPIPAMNGGAK